MQVGRNEDEDAIDSSEGSSEDLFVDAQGSKFLIVGLEPARNKRGTSLLERKGSIRVDISQEHAHVVAGLEETICSGGSNVASSTQDSEGLRHGIDDSVSEDVIRGGVQKRMIK